MNSQTNTTMKMKQLILHGDIALEESPNLTNRPQGSIECTKEDRLSEVARLVVRGHKPGEIKKELQVCSSTVRKLVRQAKREGYVRDLGFSRDQTSKDMRDRMQAVADDAVDIIQARLDHIHDGLDDPEQDDAKVLDSRAMNDAFRAFDKADVFDKGVNGKGKIGEGKGDIFQFFGKDVLKKAKETSSRIFDVEAEEIVKEEDKDLILT